MEEGESYTVCSSCGKMAHEPTNDIEMQRHEYAGWRGGSAADKIDNP